MAWKWLWMNVFLEGGGGGLFRSMGPRRAGEDGAHAETQPIELILGSAARSISGDFVSQMYKVLKCGHYKTVNGQPQVWLLSRHNLITD